MWSEFTVPDEHMPEARSAIAHFRSTGDASRLESLMRRLGAATDITSLQFTIDDVVYYRAPSGEWRTIVHNKPEEA